jgi:hypothetical protein
MAIMEKVLAIEEKLVEEFGKEELFDILTKAMDKDELQRLYEEIAIDYEIKLNDNDDISNFYGDFDDFCEARNCNLCRYEWCKTTEECKENFEKDTSK